MRISLDLRKERATACKVWRILQVCMGSQAANLRLNRAYGSRYKTRVGRHQEYRVQSVNVLPG